MVALALMVSCMPSAYTISASEAFGDGTEDIFTDGEITSEPAAEESTPDVSSADQEETEQAQQSTLTYENDSVKVTAEALEDGALPQNTALKADGVNENSSVSYDTVSQKLSAAATDKGSSLRGFFAYDVYFADGDGNRVEPNGRVRVTFEYKTPAAPELTDAASTSVTVEKLHYNNSTGDTDVNTLQANEDLKVLNVNEGKQIQTLQVETGNAAVFAVMWDSPETADVEAEAVSGNEDEVPIASEELTDGMDISDEPEQDAAETPAAENPEVTPEAEPSEEPAENPDAEPTEAPAENPDVVEEPAEDIESPDEVPAADENGETSLIEVLGDDTNLRVSPSIEAEVLATVNAGTQLTLLDTVTAEDGATWYKVSWEGTEAYIRSDMAQVVDSSDEAEEPEDVQEEEIQPEITRYDYKSDEVNVKVTLTNPADLPDNAELSVTPVELSQEAEDQITEEAIKEKKAIEKIHSYDIKFLVDGEEVQPGATVKVEVSLPDIKAGQDADVYHVDADDNVENMDGSVNKKGNIEFDTTHFSTYVIVKKVYKAVTVTIKHYDDSNSNFPVKIYSDDKVDFEVGKSGRIDNYVKATNWTVEKVVVGNNTYTKEADYSEIEVAQDTLVKVYYLPKNITTKGNVKFYDYTVNAEENQSGKKRSINEQNSYAESNRQDTYRLMVGNNDDEKIPYHYSAPSDNKKDGNRWTGKTNPSAATGLLTSISDNGKGSPVFKYADPGFFTDSDITFTVKDGQTGYLRQYLDKYKLVFAQNGDTYTLSEVQNESGTKVSGVGADFFPLDGIIKSYEKGNKSKKDSKYSNDTTPHNYYFGMRYDVEFSIDDYVGPLKYDFTGDDDLWVALDGNRVLDLGGIHDALSGSVDIWKELGITDKENLSEEEKNTKHRLTVLYMERGAGVSNCSMSFTLPNARIVNTTKEPLATLNFTKVDSGNQVLAGAKFTLVNNDTHETITATSGPDGEVSFVGLAKGEYTLTETSAPVNYVSDKTAYRVSVTSDGNTAVAHIYNDKNEVVDQIVNYTEKEEAIKNLKSSKSVSVDDYDKRTYQIDLNAEVTGREAGEAAKAASVVMVLDASRSMNDKIDGVKKINTLKTAAKQFISTLHEKSPKSEISIIWYSGSEREDSNLTTVRPFVTLDDSGVDTLNSYITTPERDIYGGTPMGAALEAANKQLDSANKENKNKYVLLMTDGLPGHWSDNDNKNCMVANNAVDNATKIKSQAVLYTVGVGLGEDSFYWNDAHSASSSKDRNHSTKHDKMSGKDFLEKLATKQEGQKYAYSTDNLSELTGIFTDIAGKIGDLFTVQPKKIVDIIDPRFELTETGLNQLADNCHLGKGTIETKQDGSKEITWKDNETKAELGKVTIVKNENGSTTITWTGGAAKIGNKEATETKNQGWKASFQIKAKDDFIGGNMVPTNGADSGIYLDNESTRYFDQPSVNVKLLSLSIGNDETTIFKGDSIDPSGYVSELAKKLKVIELDGKTNTLTGVSPLTADKSAVNLTLTPDQKTALCNGNTITLGEENSDGKYPYEYIYPGTTDAVGYFTYTYKLSDDPGGNMTLHEATSAGTAVEKYELVVTYHPYSTKTRQAMSKLSNVKVPAENGGTEVTSRNIAPVKGTYTVNVIAGQIEITKKLSGDETAQQNAEFTFEIYKVVTKDGNEEKLTTDPEIITATIKKGENVAKFGNDTKVTITGLSRGDYIVRETSHNGYTLESAVYNIGKGKTNCLAVNNDASKDVTFTIGTYGTDTEKKNALEADQLKAKDVDYGTYAGPGCVGVADFTNKEIVADVGFVKIDAAKDLNNNTITLSGVEFKLYKANDNWEQRDLVNGNVKSGTDGTFELEKLLPGNYLLVETKAATGYSVPKDPWRIKVDSEGTVTVTKTNSIPINLTEYDNKKVYQLENAKVYSLPQSGGPGTYGFTISGVAILATALLLFINNKRREEEAKRS